MTWQDNDNDKRQSWPPTPAGTRINRALPSNGSCPLQLVIMQVRYPFNFTKLVRIIGWGGVEVGGWGFVVRLPAGDIFLKCLLKFSMMNVRFLYLKMRNHFWMQKLTRVRRRLCRNFFRRPPGRRHHPHPRTSTLLCPYIYNIYIYSI